MKRRELARGYDHTWRKLSIRAREAQPFCTDCGTTRNLSTDHTPQAWRRKAEGKPIRLQDVDVVCIDCNAKRGSVRGDNPDWKPGKDRALPDLERLERGDSSERPGDQGRPEPS